MPYIKQSERDTLKPLVDLISQSGITSEGNLNYIITALCNKYLHDNKPFGYKSVNAVVGVLDCAKMEFYRRVAAKYEDTKIIENGDVY